VRVGTGSGRVRVNGNPAPGKLIGSWSRAPWRFARSCLGCQLPPLCACHVGQEFRRACRCWLEQEGGSHSLRGHLGSARLVWKSVRIQAHRDPLIPPSFASDTIALVKVPTFAVLHGLPFHWLRSQPPGQTVSLRRLHKERQPVVLRPARPKGAQAPMPEGSRRESELQRAIDAAGNDRAAFVRNLEDTSGDSPTHREKIAVYRALVEAELQLREL